MGNNKKKSQKTIMDVLPKGKKKMDE